MQPEDEAESFVAPRAPAPGTPSPEAMQRLQAAVGKAASQQQQPRNEAAAAAKPAAGEERQQRFGINSLINRMTGHNAASEAPRPARQQPQVQSAPTQQAAPRVHEEDEQIEIPAFLRRQAN